MATTTEVTISQGKRLRILVVDDYPGIAEYFATWLRRWGHEVETAMSGSEAIAAAERRHPDVMFLDVAMPNLDGYEVAKQIRNQPWSETLFLVALSGFGSEEDLERGRAAGFNTHLKKPILAAEMAAVLAAYSNRSASTVRPA